MVFCLAVVGPLVAGLAIIKAIITLGAEIHLCKKCSESLKRDMDVLREQLVPAERQHPEAAEEVRVLQLRLDRAAEDVIAEYQSKGLLRRLFRRRSAAHEIERQRTERGHVPLLQPLLREAARKELLVYPVQGQAVGSNNLSTTVPERSGKIHQPGSSSSSPGILYGKQS